MNMQRLNYFCLTRAIGIVLFFFLMIGLNGFSEGEADPGMIFYIVWLYFFR